MQQFDNDRFDNFLFGQLNPPSTSAFLLVVPPHKKSSVQVGLREIQRLKKTDFYIDKLEHYYIKKNDRNH